MRSHIRLQILLWSCLLPYLSHAQQSVQKIVTETEYLLYLPQHYAEDTGRRWPVLLFLHGSGESGHDIEKVKLHGPPQLIAQGKQFPFLVVSPQSDVPNGWDVDQLYKLLQQVQRNYRVDEDRIYCTGLSMGGFGTWKMAMKYPGLFAAIAPVCGGGDTADAWKIRNIPVWCFHGALDNVVPLSASENMVAATKRVNPDVRFTVYPNKNHNSWDTTYNTNDSLYLWLLSHKKFHYTPASISPAILKKYIGVYIGPDNDTVQLIVRQNQLMALPGRDTVPLIPSAPNLFYLQAYRNMDIRFPNPEGNVDHFIFMGDRKLLYRRIRNRK